MILVVRHGPGRGRLRDYMRPVLDHVGAARPALAAAIRHHATGEPPPRLDGVRAVVFWLADPLRERFPACFAEARAIAAEAAARGIPSVNPPERLSDSVKSVQSRIWRGAGIPTPPHRRFESRAELAAALREATFPVIVRADEEHAQAGIRILRSAADAARIPDDRLVLPGSLVPLVDVRAEWRRAGGDPLRARLHHRVRAMVMGDVVWTNSVHFSSDPIVSGTTSRFARFRGWRKPFAFLARLSPTDRLALAADAAASGRGSPHAALLRRAVAALGLSFAAVDFAERPGGGAILWEANPHFHLPPAGRSMIPGLRDTERRRIGFYEAAADFLESLLAPVPA